jgi:hypothetical protein
MQTTQQATTLRHVQKADLFSLLKERIDALPEVSTIFFVPETQTAEDNKDRFPTQAEWEAWRETLPSIELSDAESISTEKAIQEKGTIMSIEEAMSKITI